jgi:hypothetical protein
VLWRAWRTVRYADLTAKHEHCADMSQKAMRAAVIRDKDGAMEYQKVRLDPQNWFV